MKSVAEFQKELLEQSEPIRCSLTFQPHFPIAWRARNPGYIFSRLDLYACPWQSMSLTFILSKFKMAALTRAGSLPSICRKCAGLANRFGLRSPQVSWRLFDIYLVHFLTELSWILQHLLWLTLEQKTFVATLVYWCLLQFYDFEIPYIAKKRNSFLAERIVFCGYVPVKLKLQHLRPPRATPRAFEFLENFWKIPPSLGRKAVQMPPPLGILPDYCFNFSVVSIMLLVLCM